MKYPILVAFLAGLLSSFVGGTLGLIVASPYTSERTELVFIYGSLQSPLTRVYACRCLTEPILTTKLPGYAQGVRTLIPTSGSSVKGEVIAVSPTELARIDNFEDVGGRYRRERVAVGSNVLWVYLKN